MRKNKTWSINLFGRSTITTQATVEQVQNDEFWTNDTKAYLNFKPNHEVFDFSSAELTLYNRNDQSLIVKDAEVLEGVASYEVEPEVIAHFGQWTAQVRFIQADDESFTSRIIKFEVKRALGDGVPSRLTAMKSWDTFFTHAKETIDLMGEAELTRVQAEVDRHAQEEARKTAEAQREANEDGREANEQTRINKDRSRDDKIAKMEADKDAVGQRMDETAAQLAETASLLKTEDLTVNVPSDYPTLQTAFDNVSSFFFAPGTKVYINIESGFKPKLGVILKERDYRFIELVSDDEIVEVHDDFEGNFISGSHCEFPIFSLLVDMRGKGITGIALHRSATATVSDGCGVKNAASAGVFVNRLSRLYTHEGIFSGAGKYGMFVDHVGYVYARYVNLNDSGGSGLRATKGSIVEVANAEIKNATNIAILASEGTRVIGITDPTRGDKHIDVSGSGGDGIRVINGSEFIGDKVIINDCGSNGVNCSDGSKVLMNKTTMNNVKVGAVVTKNSSLSIQSGEILNASNRGIYLSESSTLDAPRIKVGAHGVGVTLNHGCNGNVRNADLKNCSSAVRVDGGSILNADGVDGTGHTGTYAFYVYTGGIINASGALGALRIEPNTITSDGIIFQ